MSLLQAENTRPLEGGPSFSFANRVARVVWNLTWLIFARYTPPPLHGWRRFILRLFGARLGKGVRVLGAAKIWLPANLTAGDNVLIGPGANIYNQGHITIGDYAVISQGAYLCASSHDLNDRNFQLQLRPITIGDHCWVAADGFVGPGVTMAEGSVVGARAALFRNSEAWGVYSGNPAQLIKHRAFRN